jgi:hypothetical protein
LYKTLAESFFGFQGYIDPSNPNTLKPVVRKFLDAVISATWNRWRKILKRDKKAEAKHTEEMDELWTREFKISDRRCVQCLLRHIFCVLSGITDTSKPNPSAAEIRRYLKKMEVLVLLLKRRRDDKSMERVEGLIGRLQDMLAAMGVDSKGKGRQTRK